VAHAARFLTEGLLKQDVPWDWLLYVPVGAHGVRPPSFESHSLCHDRDGGRTPYAPTKDASGSALRVALQKHPCDLLFVPSGACAPGISVPQIPWVHDLAIFDHPEWFPESWLRRQITTRLFARGLHRAPIIFAVSEETKNQIVVHLKIDPKKIVVTHEGGDPVLSSRAQSRDPLTPHARDSSARRKASSVGMTENFCLAVGTIEPRKNFGMLARIWSDVFKQTGRRLVIVGKKGWGNVLIKEENGIEICESVGEGEKRQLIKSADIVLVSSLYEGFGLVALEAMQAGTALISSDRGALPEVVGYGGLLLSPEDEFSWNKEVVRLLKDDVVRVQLAEKGKLRSEDFSWEKTANRIVEGMQNIL
jgi:alpha-1,3-rhamnosyl/mannosyltransferase